MQDVSARTVGEKWTFSAGGGGRSTTATPLGYEPGPNSGLRLSQHTKYD